MNKIIVVCKNAQIEQYFNGFDDFFAQLGIKCITLTPQELEKSPHLIDLASVVFIDFSVWDDTTTLASNIPKYLVISLDQDKNKDKLELIFKQNNAIDGWIDTSLEHLYYLPLLKSFLRPKHSKNERIIKLQVMEKNLRQIVSDTLVELQRVKTLHAKLVPMKKTKLKGLNLYSKYLAGESSGGEFFDIVQKDREFLLVLSSTSSYLLSAMVLSHFEALKEKKGFSIDEMEAFLSDLCHDADNLLVPETAKRSNKRLLNVFIARIDLNTMTMAGFNFGQSELISNSSDHYLADNNMNICSSQFNSAYFEMKMKRAEELILLSPGIRLNSSGIMGNIDLVQFIRNNFNKGPENLINEIFYKLKSNCESSFLKHDSSLIYIEVDKNVIMQV
ncbi:MAG: hypothetical protein ISR65_13305 [Bacteriovoracaceae bacterium]|nr:hypothetical protein [Bacteriovoracaceae bacterium]